MTPLEEQVEKLARRWEKEADEGELLDEVAYALEGAADELRTLLPLEVTDESEARITDEMVEAGAKAMFGKVPLTATRLANTLARDCLSAALTQKGEA